MKLFKNSSAVVFQIVSACFLVLNINYSSACTAAIVSSSAAAEGRPLLWKHRDTGNGDNHMAFFRGEFFDFTALANCGSENEVWIGTNTAGFSIMNTASYNLKDDTVPEEMMDREGALMYTALGKCSSALDFEHFLDTCARPLGVEAQFGVIDASGAAVLYEVDNSGWVKYDVNDPEVAPEGYIVFTNFAFSGRKEDVKGYERYVTAKKIFSEISGETDENCGRGEKGISPDDIFNCLSRSLRNEILGTDYLQGYTDLMNTGQFKGMVVDQDFIPRRITSASVVIQGTRIGEDPSKGVLWVMLGYPFTSFAVPVPSADMDVVPSFLGSRSENGHSSLCDFSYSLRDSAVFTGHSSNGDRYMDISGIPGEGGLLDISRRTEADVRKIFEAIHDDFVSGACSLEEYYARYRVISENFFGIYMSNLKPFMERRERFNCSFE